MDGLPGFLIDFKPFGKDLEVLSLLSKINEAFYFEICFIMLNMFL
jgi:hypothetical protein